MLKIQFTNAVVADHGYGLTVNGKSLEDIISTALGTKVGNNSGHGSMLPSFQHNCCNITVIIDPQRVKETITSGEDTWHSVKDMEEEKREQYNEAIKATES